MTARTLPYDEAGLVAPAVAAAPGPGPAPADPALTLEAARRHIVEAALHESSVGLVGLELEMHLVDLAAPARRPEWDEVTALVTGLPAMPSGSAVTLEPGGQIELSTPPAEGVAAAVAALAADRVVLRAALAEAGFGAAPLGTDPARPVRRVNPAGRYVAMEEHFTALGCADPGRAMMTSTAALQVNLDAGPRAGWVDRLALVAALGPVLVAVSSGSPWLAGRTSGWHSMRQQVWDGIDHSRSVPIASGDPTQRWATYALDAPVMLVRGPDTVRPVTQRVPFRDWLTGDAPIDRAPTTADLDYHLTTLFPPVRPRGYVEIRCLDALPDRWWPAVAALVAVLLDDPGAASRATEATAPVAGSWTSAARDGLRDPALRAAASACVAAAVDHAPAPLRADLEALAELVTAGRTPGDELRARADALGPLALLEEEARA